MTGSSVGVDVGGTFTDVVVRAPSGRLIAELDINRNHKGRDLEGNPTNLKDNAFIIRGEVSF